MRAVIAYLNHASVLLDLGEVRLLFDPWYSGTAFSDGWGLRYENPDAMDRAATATHLWISHWHSDHLHAPTLAALAKRSPGIRVLVNVSLNFTMMDRLAGFGFTNLVPLEERRSLEIAKAVHVCRYPTAGIDNVLHVRAPGASVLNYNDVNLPSGALRALMRRIGDVDVLLTNYNHAGKLFDPLSDAAQKDMLMDVLVRTADIVAPRYVVPFASSHYYRSDASCDQNRSLLSFDELAQRLAHDPRFTVLRVGDEVAIEPDVAPQITQRSPPLRESEETIHRYGESVALEQLLKDASVRCRRIHAQFLRGTALLPELRVEVTDLGQTLILRAGEDARVARASDGKPHIAAHSEALGGWLGRRFGDDTFVAGAHFRVVDPDTRVMRWWALVTLLEASQLDPRSLLRSLRSRRGLDFWLARREEIAVTLLSGRLRAGQMRL